MTLKGRRILAVFSDYFASLNHFKVLIEKNLFSINKLLDKDFDRSKIIVVPLKLDIFVKP
jgi:hypothetical protein